MVDRRRGLVLATVLATGLAATVVLVPTAQAASGVPRDGSRPERAAASCFEVKQEVPAAADGTYWIQTPALRAPMRVWCDQTTDGGGWELVGRGRDGWSWGSEGQGTPDDLASSATGAAPYKPAQLPTDTISAMLGGSVDSLPDGIRLRRATDAAGTTWQEARLRASGQAEWSWAFPAALPLTKVSTLTRLDGSASAVAIDGGRTDNDKVAGLSTRQLQLGPTATGWDRIRTTALDRDGYVRGFHGGPGATAGTAASSFTYSTASSGDEAVGFTQVWVRPRVLQKDLSYGTIPSKGVGARTAAPLAESEALPQTWGVAAPTSSTDRADEFHTEVQAIERVGTRMFVGGNFPRLIKGANGSGGSIAQPYLAAFDEKTGEPIASFKPTFNGQVKALRELPGGLLAVGGDFTRVNGQPRGGLAILGSKSGALSSRYPISLERRAANGDPLSVRALDYDRGRLYVGGAFTHVVRGGKATYVRNLARFSTSSGNLDTRWTPTPNGTVMDLDVSSGGSTIYAVGFFDKLGSAVRKRAAAISVANGSSAGWTPRFSTTGVTTQQAVQYVNNRIWVGGSQHSLFRYDPKRYGLTGSAVALIGGDFQEITTSADSSVLYAGCHCGDWIYDGGRDWDSMRYDPTTSPWSRAWRMSYVGAWSTSTGKVLGSFSPQLRTRFDGGHGTWGLATSSNGTLWVGGDFDRVIGTSGTEQWVGGFARFGPRPTTAPAAPSRLRVRFDAAKAEATVSWNASSTPGITYEVIRNDRTVRTTTSTTLVISDAQRYDRYAVRASDGRGNRSATTPLVGSS